MAIFGIYDLSLNQFRDGYYNSDITVLIESFYDYWVNISWQSLSEDLRSDGQIANDEEIECYLKKMSHEKFLKSEYFEVQEADFSWLQQELCLNEGGFGRIRTIGDFIEENRLFNTVSEEPNEEQLDDLAEILVEHGYRLV